MFLLVAALPAAAFTASDRDASFNEAVAAMKLGNYAIALEKFTILAEQGDLAAQYDLGWMRARGLGARTDNVAAYQWFSLVAKAGQELGRQALSDIRGRMSAAEIAEGERRAAAWRPNQMTR